MTLISTKNVKKYSLSNGLTILYERNESAPVISLNIGVKIGSVWEADDEAGLSHVLEHMVFKGTQSYKPGEIATIVEASGGELNAYTHLDQTVYYINLPSAHWRKALNILKEMAFEATINSAELARELEVVLEELRRSEDDPNHVLSKILFASAYQKHPYGRPIIGFEKTIRNFTQEKVLDFYHRWYVPNNMVLAICGNFNEEDLRKAIDEEFSSFVEKPVHRPPVPEEPSLSSSRHVTKPFPVQGNYLSIAFPIPELKHKDVPVLDLLAHLLGGSNTSRLEQEVKEKKKLVSSINAVAFTPAFPGLFMIGANYSQESAIRVSPAIYEEINFARDHFFPDEALERAKAGMKASLFYEKETCEGTARKWVVYETVVGDFRFEEQYLSAIEKVTREDLRNLARKYLKTESGVTALLYPAGKKTASFPTPKTKKKARRNTELVLSACGIQKFRLANGIIVLTRENHRLPLISLRSASLGGLRYETSRNNGITNLTTSLMEKGTLTKNALKIAEICEEIAGNLDVSAGRNSWGVSSSFLTEKRGKGLELFCDVLLNPAFDPQEFSKEKKLALEAIKNQKDSPVQLTFLCFQKLLFKQHPYGLPLLGTRESVEKLSPDQIKTYYKKILHPKNLVISAVGDFKTDEMIEELSSAFSGLKESPLKLPAIKRETPQKEIRTKEIRQKKQQAHVLLGFQSPALTNPDHYPMQVLHHILAGMGGRLFLELRDKQSLAYTVTSWFIEGVDPGMFAVYIGTEPGKLDKAITEIISELTKVRTFLVSPEELDRAKNYLVGNYELDLQRNSAVAGTIVYDELYGQGIREFEEYPRKILKVTSEEVLLVAKKYLRLSAYSMAVLKP